MVKKKNIPKRYPNRRRNETVVIYSNDLIKNVIYSNEILKSDNIKVARRVIGLDEFYSKYINKRKLFTDEYID